MRFIPVMTNLNQTDRNHSNMMICC